MIDLDAPLKLPGLAVRAWADSDDPAQVWACADGPRWAVGSGGTPEVSLLLYRRGGGAVEGGMATVTVDLALTTAEHDAVVVATTALRGADPADQPPAAGPSATEPSATEPSAIQAPAVSPPQWSGGTIHLELCPGVSATSDVSAMGDNRATFVLTLDGVSGPQVARAWADGLPEARAVAELSVRSTRRSAAAGGHRTVQPGLRSQMDVAMAVTHAVDAPLRLTGELRLPPAVRTRSTTDITL